MEMIDVGTVVSELNADLGKLKVLIYIFEHTSPKSYIFKGSYDAISRGTGISFSAVQKTMSDAQKVGLIKRVGAGIWHIEEKIFEGSDDEPYVMIKNYT